MGYAPMRFHTRRWYVKSNLRTWLVSSAHASVDTGSRTALRETSHKWRIRPKSSRKGLGGEEKGQGASLRHGKTLPHFFKPRQNVLVFLLSGEKPKSSSLCNSGSICSMERQTSLYDSG